MMFRACTQTVSRRIKLSALLSGLVALVAQAMILPLLADAAIAKQRHALVIGVSDYGKTSGLAPLNAPVYDAEMVKHVLERLRHPFAVEMLSNDEVKDKDTFSAAFERFLERVQPGDEVLFYFSGHGYNIAAAQGGGPTGNFYLLPSAKSRDALLKDMPAAEVRGLETEDRKEQAYSQWISTVALSEVEIENAIHARKPDSVVLIADACRSLIKDAKGISLISGVSLPSERAKGTFRLYSASPGQISLDSPDPIEIIDERPGAPNRNRKDAKKQKRSNSLFTRVLLSEIAEPGHGCHGQGGSPQTSQFSWPVADPRFQRGSPK
jgi:hypothetical protein